MKWILACALLVVAAAMPMDLVDPEETSTDKNIFEGDMILTPQQILIAEQGGDIDSLPLGKRDATIGKQWPKGVVVYKISSSLGKKSSAKKAIEDAMAEWTAKTCITFKLRTNQKAFVEFVPHNKGCSAEVGYTGRRQTVNLHSKCWKKGIVIHELGHTIGFYHEQSRPDRDNFVNIYLNNVDKVNEHNFDKYKHSLIDSLGSPYDYGSIMHYQRKAFTNNGKDTITPKQRGKTIGQRNGLSAIDAEQTNLLYNVQCGLKLCLDSHARCEGWKSHCRVPSIKKMCKKTCKQC